jgi:hypothetical protein
MLEGGAMPCAKISVPLPAVGPERLAAPANRRFHSTYGCEQLNDSGGGADASAGSQRTMAKKTQEKQQEFPLGRLLPF